MAEKTLSLTDAAYALASRGTPIPYRELWGAVVEMRVPAKRVGKRWAIREDDLDSIAQALSQARG